jgi:exonuclease SbcC
LAGLSEGKVEAINQKLTVLRSHLEKARLEVSEITGQMSQLTASDDPESSRIALLAKVEGLNKALQVAKDGHAQASQKRAVAEQRFNDRHAALQRARDNLLALAELVERAVGQAKFSSISEAREALLPSATRVDLEAKVRAFEVQDEQIRVRIREHLDALGGERVSAEDLNKIEVRLSEVRTHVGTLQSDVGEFRANVCDLRERLQKCQALLDQLEVLKSKHVVEMQLCKDLKSDGFQAFLLEESFRELVSGASHRLMELSREDYALAIKEDNFYVVDHNNGSQERRADTLSGGETFLASLALALELSAQVQKAAGTGRLDSLFIDEGFGTLDPETLDVVAQAIETLHAGGRMVGVITHIPELSQRLPARIVVSKDSRGSNFRLDRDAV